MFVKKQRLGSHRSSHRANEAKVRDSDRTMSLKSKNIADDEFEIACLGIIKSGDWNKLEIQALDHLDKCKGKSHKGFFYLGIALYKMGYYEQSIKAYQKSNELDANDA